MKNRSVVFTKIVVYIRHPEMNQLRLYKMQICSHFFFFTIRTIPQRVNSLLFKKKIE